MEVVECSIIQSIKVNDADVLIHGHTHVPKKVFHKVGEKQAIRYVLGSWDDNPNALCYYKTYGFEFKPLMVYRSE